jgi:hypothetical protein
MNAPTTIRLLAAANNERGDLFTRLVRDLFFALAYDDLRLNVHKTGREIDLQGHHRLEPRFVLAECKAHSTRMGGEDLNKFFGILTRERRKSDPTPVAGYFVSLGGFTETGIDQEIETGEDRVILLNARQVIEELVRSRVVVDRMEAVERAGQCAQLANLADAVLEDAELLGHQRGYLWAIYYTHGKERTHFALIHADGTPLAETVAKEVVEADRQCEGTLHCLRYLPPPLPPPDRAVLVEQALGRYRQWLGEECGFIQLDGLPADTDLSATRLKLERLFIPLKASIVSNPEDHPDAEQNLRDEILSIGEVLRRSQHFALLASPGGGKSTVLKRLATAYASPERRTEISDDLPERDWLPLFLRCRELRDRTHRPILELLDDLPNHSGMDGKEAAGFREFVHEALREGRVLLLVDGLDEISDPGARTSFAHHLRTFQAMFPLSGIIITSREAGFRLVAGVIATACERVKLAPLEEADVLRLCEHWHVEVVGNSDKIRTEARQLAQAIWENDRIRPLVENPLLLTTLLVVKRWMGDVPRNRAALYREAIRVLVRTWNVEGYSPLDEDETLAQLYFVACAMTERGEQQIGQKALLKLLQEARHELDAELQFTRISPQEFIERIEYRSSLLMQTGHAAVEGELQPVYEFRHLNFQEYLAARGYVEQQYPGRESGRSFADLFEPHFKDERWREVISLASVLAGRKGEETLKRLTQACEILSWESPPGSRSDEDAAVVLLLQQCLLDEVQVSAPILRVALRQVARSLGRLGRGQGLRIAFPKLLRGKFGEILQEIVLASYMGTNEDWGDFDVAMVELALANILPDGGLQTTEALSLSLLRKLELTNRSEKIFAALICMRLAFENRRNFREKREVAEISKLKAYFSPLYPLIAGMVNSGDPKQALAAAWALAWIYDARLSDSPIEPSLVLSLFGFWRDTKSPELTRMAAWALSAHPLLPRDTIPKTAWGDCDAFLRGAAADEYDRDWSYYRDAALVVSWYRCAPLSEAELAAKLGETLDTSVFRYNAGKILETLGPIGRPVLEEWKHKKTRSALKLRRKVGLPLEKRK